MDLSLLGLNTYESQAYTALLELHEATASEISKHSEVPYGRIYDVLASLQQKGLLRLIPKNTKTYTPTSPKELKGLLEEKQQELIGLSDELTKLTQQYERREGQVIEVVTGHKNFFRLLKDMPRAEEFEYSIKYTSKYHGRWVVSDKEKIKQGLDKKVLTRFDEETKPDVKKWLKVVKQQRVFENQGAALSISEKGVMIALIKNNTTMFIRDKALVDVLKRLFEAAYEKAAAIKL